MQSEELPKKKEEGGGAGWIMTFADLMSLLMCFFVLLLSFSEMDVQKFKQLAGSMKMAFGVQREIKAKEPPKGTSIIAREFSPGKPEPTALPEVRQMTIKDSQQQLYRGGEQGDEKMNELEEQMKKLAAMLKKELKTHEIEMEVRDQAVVIRMMEGRAFEPGSAVIKPSFIPVLENIREALSLVKGDIVITGHTDDQPVESSLYRSNWDLSAARAVSVTHKLLEFERLPRERFVVRGVADTEPLVPNEDEESRARNRRVEIELIQNAKPRHIELVNEGEANEPVQQGAETDEGQPAPLFEETAPADDSARELEAGEPLFWPVNP